jgi:pyruvate/2-oxoglutarate dehydrogenase complex dihydrolipoamide dehydrogenase (E3) component
VADALSDRVAMPLTRRIHVAVSAGILVGATSAGPAGGEVLGVLYLAVHAPVPIERLQQMIYAYPTFHGAIPEGIGRLR